MRVRVKQDADFVFFFPTNAHCTDKETREQLILLQKDSLGNEVCKCLQQCVICDQRLYSFKTPLGLCYVMSP